MPSTKEAAYWIFVGATLVWVGYGFYYLAIERTDVFVTLGVILGSLWVYSTYRTKIA